LLKNATKTKINEFFGSINIIGKILIKVFKNKRKCGIISMNYSGIKNGSKVYLIDRFIRLFIKDNGERDVLY
jgi:hypothetical protein